MANLKTEFRTHERDKPKLGTTENKRSAMSETTPAINRRSTFAIVRFFFFFSQQAENKQETRAGRFSFRVFRFSRSAKIARPVFNHGEEVAGWCCFRNLCKLFFFFFFRSLPPLSHNGFGSLFSVFAAHSFIAWICKLPYSHTYSLRVLPVIGLTSTLKKRICSACISNSGSLHVLVLFVFHL